MLGDVSLSVSMNLKVKDYTSRVLGVVKEKYGLKDKAEALDRFAEMYGDEFVDREVKEELIKEVIESCERHIKKYGFRSRSIAELRKKIEAD
jgi:hypothetical protein